MYRVCENEKGDKLCEGKIYNKFGLLSCEYEDDKNIIIYICRNPVQIDEKIKVESIDKIKEINKKTKYCIVYYLNGKKQCEGFMKFGEFYGICKIYNDFEECVFDGLVKNSKFVQNDILYKIISHEGIIKKYEGKMIINDELRPE